MGHGPQPPTAPIAQLVHSAPGRVRLRVAALRGATRALTELAHALEKIEGVGNVHPNVVTGSLLIEGMGMSIEDLQQTLHMRGYLRIAREWSDELVDSALIGWRRTGLDVLERAAPLAMFALAVVQAARGQFLPPALSLALYALDASRARNADATQPKMPLGS